MDVQKSIHKNIEIQIEIKYRLCPSNVGFFIIFGRLCSFIPAAPNLSFIPVTRASILQWLKITIITSNTPLNSWNVINPSARLAFTFLIRALSYFHHHYDITSFFSEEESVNEHTKCNQDSLSTHLFDLIKREENRRGHAVWHHQGRMWLRRLTWAHWTFTPQKCHRDEHHFVHLSRICL